MKKTKKKKEKSDVLKNNPLPSDKVDLLKIPPSKTDPLGSYTGVCQSRNEIPTQDADDL